ncbi:MAG: MerR family transcriptional regulator [Atopobiaceae bacterium]|nr:MerR family transcriptional regulator [Atopobiaceae bacterium]
MKTVREVSELCGVSIRTLQYYDQIGLLCPATRTEAGYRLYDDADLERLQQILLFRELEFPLKDIKRIVDSPHFNRSRALEQQIELLELKRKRLSNLIKLAKDLKAKETKTMTFEPFSTKEIDTYAARAKASWGNTPEWKEYERISAGRSKGEESAMGEELMTLFVPFGEMSKRGVDPANEEAMLQAKRIQDYISKHFYTCSDEVFLQLGQAYGCGGDFTQNIDAAAGAGAAVFAMKAVKAYVANNRHQ